MRHDFMSTTGIDVWDKLLALGHAHDEWRAIGHPLPVE